MWLILAFGLSIFKIRFHDFPVWVSSFERNLRSDVVLFIIAVERDVVLRTSNFSSSGIVSIGIRSAGQIVMPNEVDREASHAYSTRQITLLSYDKSSYQTHTHLRSEPVNNPLFALSVTSTRQYICGLIWFKRYFVSRLSISWDQRYGKQSRAVEYYRFQKVPGVTSVFVRHCYVTYLLVCRLVMLHICCTRLIKPVL
jgi:hypothetical protein